MAEGLTRRLLLIGGIGPIPSIPKGNRRIVHKLGTCIPYLGMDLIPTYLLIGTCRLSIRQCHRSIQTPASPIRAGPPAPPRKKKLIVMMMKSGT